MFQINFLITEEFVQNQRFSAHFPFEMANKYKYVYENAIIYWIFYI